MKKLILKTDLFGRFSFFQIFNCNAIMQYYSLLPKKAMRFNGSMFLSSSVILS